jgi:histidinol-phosphate aminotransferase
MTRHQKPHPNSHVASMAPYALANLSAPPGKRLISLAQNESAVQPSPVALTAARAALADAQLYPDPDWHDLRAAIAEVHHIDPALILCGSGSMELIAALATAYLGPGDRALTTAYGYLFFRTATRLARAEIDLAPETDLTVDIDALLGQFRTETRIVFVANPGNPTGTRIPRAELLRLRYGLPSDALLVIDEAYGEFAETPAESMFDLVSRGDTVILRTFSKVYGLASMRVGWGVFPAAVAVELRKVLNPSNIGAAAQAAAAAAMRDQTYMLRVRAETAARRDHFAARMRDLGISVPQSHTNFALLCFPSAASAAAAEQALHAEGILLRSMDGYGLANCLRATIGAPHDMELAYQILAAMIEKESTT